MCGNIEFVYDIFFIVCVYVWYVVIVVCVVYM